MSAAAEPPLRAALLSADQMEQYGTQGIEDGSVAPCNPKLAVFALFGAINWVPKWYRSDGEFSAAQVADMLVDLITTGIASHQPNPAPKVVRSVVRQSVKPSLPKPRKPGDKK